MPRVANARHAAVVIRGTKVVLTCVKLHQTKTANKIYPKTAGWGTI
jgi:hypothetical protein